MISDGSQVGVFVRFPQVLVYEKGMKKVLFEIAKDLDLLHDKQFIPLPGSVQGFESQQIQFWDDTDYDYLRYPYGVELRDYEQNKSI